MADSGTHAVVAQVRTRTEAEHIVAFLSNNNVDALLWTDDVGGLNPAMGFVEAFQVRVHTEQAAIATELLQDFGLSR